MSQRNSKLPGPGSKLARPVKAQGAFEKSVRAAGVPNKLLAKYENDVLESLPEPAIADPQAQVPDFSDNSFEDLKVGDRVITTKGKKGQIAYIGETSFAKGLLVGLVLDECYGNHDGMYNGIRYFQCDPNRGTFVRADRVRKLPSQEFNANSKPISSLSSSSATPPLEKTTPTDSVLPAPPSSLDYGIGDRVIVSGTKHGTVRFIGLTQFSDGTWIGVELDQPLGKNNGVVKGQRYFMCEPDHGLFAKPGNVMKEPPMQSRKTPIMPYGGRKMSRDLSGSMESISSIGSSVCSSVSRSRVRLGVGAIQTKKTNSRPSMNSVSVTTLQKAIKEKEQHITQLLKERDDDRAEIASAYNKQDEAECYVQDLKKEFNIIHDENMELKQTLQKLENDLLAMTDQLDDERRKVEELEFAKEEGTIEKEELQSKKIEEDQRYIQLLNEKDAALKELNEIKRGNIIETKDNKELLKQLEEAQTKCEEYNKTKEIALTEMMEIKQKLAYMELDKKQRDESFKESIFEREAAMEKVLRLETELSSLKIEKDNENKKLKEFLEEKNTAEKEYLDKISLLEENQKSISDSVRKEQLEKQTAANNVKDLMDEIGILKEDQKAKEELLQNAVAEKEKVLYEINDMKQLVESQRQAVEESLQNALSENEILKRQLLELENSLKKDKEVAVESRQQTLSENENLKQELLALEKKLTTQKESIEVDLKNSHFENENLKQDLLKSNNKLKSLEEEQEKRIKQLVLEKQNIADDLGNMTKRVENYEKNLSSDGERMKEIISEKENVMREIRQLKNTLSADKEQYDKKLKDTIAEKDRTISELTEAEKQISQLNRRLKAVSLKEYIENLDYFFSLSFKTDEAEVESFRLAVQEYIDGKLKSVKQESVKKENGFRNDLEEKISTLENTIQELKHSKASTAKQFEDCKSEKEDLIKSLEQKLLDLENVSKCKDQEIQLLQQLKRDNESKINNLLTDKENSEDKINGKVDQLKDSLKKELQEKSSLETKVQDLEQTLDLEKKNKYNLEDEIIKLKENMDNLIFKHDEAVNDMQIQVGQQEEAYNQLEKRYTNVQTHLNELMKNDALKAHANDNLECTIKDLKTEIADLKQKLAIVSTEKQERDAEVTNLFYCLDYLVLVLRNEGQATSSDILNPGATQQIDDLLKKCHELESEVFEKDELLINLQKQIEDLTKHTTNVSGNNSQIEELRKKTVEQSNQIDLLSGEKARLQATSDLNFELKEDLHRRVTQITSELEKIKNEKAVLKQDFESKIAQQAEELKSHRNRSSPAKERDRNDNSSQVKAELDFQKTIIADQQKQILELQRQIDILKTGDESDDPLEQDPITIKRRARLYCDICEEFDNHNTEDCPLNDSQTF
ncbi:DgyrCDS9297 [Dimorphilus gyrociliatus]|uniref:DgyrCDS9297 n=1 Tax=Dimorphilus gyrociliatus TaxID=2664684 RepID=A0A7I8VWL6_9ANNE|nr:DgyrCDS9297 [Dimorphilus gyrociliatus]